MVPKSISNCLVRASELKQSAPIISYYCELWCVERLLGDRAHQTDEDSKFVLGLLDQVEAAKAELGEHELEIVRDEQLSVAYVHNFVTAVFNNLSRQITDKKANRATALGLLALVQFISLFELWPENSVNSDEDVKKMGRYAKFHAARILKGIKAGEDVNGEEEDAEHALPGGGSGEPSDAPSDAPSDGPSDAPSDGPSDVADGDELARLKAQMARLMDEPDSDGVADGVTEAPNHALSLPEVSPEAPEAADHTLSLPEVPDEAPEAADHTVSLPEVPDEAPEAPNHALSLPEVPDEVPAEVPAEVPDEVPAEAPAQAPACGTTPSAAPIDIQHIIDTDEVYSQATRHCKFSISAMNYEDRETAIKELEAALGLLRSIK